MHNYHLSQSWQVLLQPDIVSMLTQIHEFRGEQNLFIEANRDTLSRLMDIAKIQSTEASNKIEGIYTSDERIKKLVMDKTMPRTRSEQEIAGYRDVLSTIHESYEYIPLKSNILLQLHQNLYKFSGAGAGGHYKMSDNQITETDSNGVDHLRFAPVPAWETPEAVELACASFDQALADGADPLLIIPMFILDFLCIHPFSDGNGRMSRLLTLLLSYRAGYIVGKYISVEKVIETSKETYYEALHDSSVGWHENKNDYAPFVRYMLGTMLYAYREFSNRVRVLTTASLSKPERIAEILQGTLGKITKAELIEKCPDISPMTIQRTLADLREQGFVTKVGGGRYTSYIWNKERTS